MEQETRAGSFPYVSKYALGTCVWLGSCAGIPARVWCDTAGPQLVQPVGTEASSCGRVCWQHRYLTVNNLDPADHLV